MKKYHYEAGATVDIERLQKKRTRQERLEKGSGSRNVDKGNQIQLEIDGCSSIRQSWMETRARSGDRDTPAVMRYVRCNNEV